MLPVAVQIDGAEVRVYALPEATAVATAGVAARGILMMQPAAAVAVLRGPQQQIKGLVCHSSLRLLAAVGLDKAVYLFS